MIIKNDRLKIEKFTISDAFFWSKIDSNPKVRHFVDGKKFESYFTQDFGKAPLSYLQSTFKVPVEYLKTTAKAVVLGQA